MFAIYINCRKNPFIALIVAHMKLWETRTRNVLGGLVGKRIYLAETGRGKPKIRASATIESYTIVSYDDVAMRKAACIYGTEYDIKPGQTKVFYKLSNVRKVKPREIPANHVNHGRSYTEF